MIGHNKQIIEKLLINLGKEFQMTTSNCVKSFLGIEIHCEQDCLKLKQTDYASKIVERYKMENSKPVTDSNID